MLTRSHTVCITIIDYHNTSDRFKGFSQFIVYFLTAISKFLSSASTRFYWLIFIQEGVKTTCWYCIILSRNECDYGERLWLIWESFWDRISVSQLLIGLRKYSEFGTTQAGQFNDKFYTQVKFNKQLRFWNSETQLSEVRIWLTDIISEIYSTFASSLKYWPISNSPRSNRSLSFYLVGSDSMQ